MKELKNKVNLEYFDTLKKALRKVFIDIDLKNKKNINQTILFSPSAASFDSFKNFEERGKKFNTLIKKIIDAR